MIQKRHQQQPIKSSSSTSISNQNEIRPNNGRVAKSNNESLRQTSVVNNCKNNLHLLLALTFIDNSRRFERRRRPFSSC